MKWYLKVLRQYADFGGRARRREYWLFSLFNMLVYVALVWLCFFFAPLLDDPTYTMVVAAILCGLYSLAVAIPGLAVAVRRLHDTGRSGWFILLALIPYLGSLILMIILMLGSKEGENQYGEDPRKAERGLPKDGMKSATVFLIIASMFWIFTNLFDKIKGMEDPYRWEYFMHSVPQFILNQLHLAFPVGVLFFAVSYLCRKDKIYKGKVI